MNRRIESSSVLPANCAEWLLDLGKCVERQSRRGAGIEEVAQKLFANPVHCKLALLLYRNGAAFKLRALIEDWSWDQIVSELDVQQRQSEPKEQAGIR